MSVTGQVLDSAATCRTASMDTATPEVRMTWRATAARRRAAGEGEGGGEEEEGNKGKKGEAEAGLGWRVDVRRRRERRKTEGGKAEQVLGAMVGMVVEKGEGAIGREEREEEGKKRL